MMTTAAIRTSITKKRRTSGGFTLVELLVVLVVIALIAALAAPRFRGPLTGAGLRRTADELTAALRGARSWSRDYGGPAALMLDLENRRFARVTPDGRIDWLGSWPEDLHIAISTAEEAIAPDKRRAQIVFFPDGTSLGGRITLVRGENRISITIDWLTGRVHLAQQSG